MCWSMCLTIVKHFFTSNLGGHRKIVRVRILMLGALLWVRGRRMGVYESMIFVISAIAEVFIVAWTTSCSMLLSSENEKKKERKKFVYAVIEMSRKLYNFITQAKRKKKKKGSIICFVESTLIIEVLA
eukprot:Rmarinus@m.15988